jgi:hypothetical protein
MLSTVISVLPLTIDSLVYYFRLSEFEEIVVLLRHAVIVGAFQPPYASQQPQSSKRGETCTFPKYLPTNLRIQTFFTPYHTFPDPVHTYRGPTPGQGATGGIQQAYCLTSMPSERYFRTEEEKSFDFSMHPLINTPFGQGIRLL